MWLKFDFHVMKNKKNYLFDKLTILRVHSVFFVRDSVRFFVVIFLATFLGHRNRRVNSMIFINAKSADKSIARKKAYTSSNSICHHLKSSAGDLNTLPFLRTYSTQKIAVSKAFIGRSWNNFANRFEFSLNKKMNKYNKYYNINKRNTSFFKISKLNKWIKSEWMDEWLN